jgi:UDP-N-acetylmuramate dehydrogenase
MPITGSLAIQHHTDLRAFNTFAISAIAREVALLRGQSQLCQVRTWLAGRTPVILGGGSNVLISADLEAPVLAVRLHQSAQFHKLLDGSILVHAPAGLEWDALVRWTLSQGWAGLENLSLIPGQVGASPIQNIGAYGVELKDRLDSLTAWNWRSGEKRLFTKAECGLSYRDSFFKHGTGKEWIILSVCLRLRPFGEQPLDLDYGDIRQQLTDMGVESPNAALVGKAVSAIRKRKLPDPNILGNAGSFFKNPVVPRTLAQQLTLTHPTMPNFATADATRTKLSAAWLIDQCGWKGFREGDAGVHQHHALVLVNYGQANGAQLLALAKNIQRSVRERFSVDLEAEPSVLPVPL